MRLDSRLLLAVVAIVVAAILLWRHERSRLAAPPAGWERVDHVADGDTIVLRGRVTVRLVQIDTPEVYFHAECYGEQASAETKQFLHRGSLVRLERDPVTTSTDVYGRLLRYVIMQDGVNLNLRLVADGAAAPYFFDGERGRYAETLMESAESARAGHKGLWGACPRTVLDPQHGVSTGDPAD
jgi:endonuclease YncB( thermonuclease family)